MRTRAVAVLCLSLVVLTPVAAASSPAGAAPTCATGGGFFGGQQQNGWVSTWGAAATLTVQDVQTWCTSPSNPNITGEWTMLKGQNTLGKLGYTQAGLAICPSNCMGAGYYKCLWAEYNVDYTDNPNGFTQNTDCAITRVPNFGDTGWVFYNLYNVDCYLGVPCEEMGAWVPGYGFDTYLFSNFSPVTSWADRRDFYSTETYYSNTTSPGLPASKVTFSGLESQAPNTNYFSSPPPGTFQVFTNPLHANTCVNLPPNTGNSFSTWHLPSGSC